jgi:GTP cyclohydrolase I
MLCGFFVFPIFSFPDFQMKMRSGAFAGAAYPSDLLSQSDIRAGKVGDDSHMAIQHIGIRSYLDHHMIPISRKRRNITADIDYLPCISRIDRRPIVRL